MALSQSVKEKIPDWLTISRVFLTLPVWAFIFFAEDMPGEIYRTIFYWSAFTLCVCAGFTDFFDGYLARKWKRKNKAGEIIDTIGSKIDPIADKLFAYPILWALSAPTGLIVFIFVRDLLIILLRHFLEGYQLAQKTSMSAKIKTVIMFFFMLTAILVALYFPHIDVWWDWYFAHILAVMTAWTLLHYYWDGIKLLWIGD